MVRVWMVRHGEAETAWGAGDPDPGLSALGRRQAEEAARALAVASPVRILTSPLRRCRETAVPFAALTGLRPEVDARVAEIASPPGLPSDGRRDWLARAFEGEWSAIEGGDYAAWRGGVVAAVTAAPGAAVFTHFVAINAALSAATGSERVVVRRPANAAIVVFETDGARLTLIDAGVEAEGAVL